MSKTPTYNIDETLLQQRFAGFEVPFEEKNWDELEKNLDQVKTQSPIALGKVNLKLVLIPVFIGLAAAFVYANFDKFKSTDNKIDAASISVQPAPTENSAVQPTANENTSPVVVSEKPKTDTTQKVVEKSIVKEPVAASPIAKAAEPVKTEAKKENDTTTNITTVAKEKIADTSEPRSTKKKKKKRKHSTNAIDEIRSTSLIPSSLDDDVVVPNN